MHMARTTHCRAACAWRVVLCPPLRSRSELMHVACRSATSGLRSMFVSGIAMTRDAGRAPLQKTDAPQPDRIVREPAGPSIGPVRRIRAVRLRDQYGREWS